MLRFAFHDTNPRFGLAPSTPWSFSRAAQRGKQRGKKEARQRERERERERGGGGEGELTKLGIVQRGRARDTDIP